MWIDPTDTSELADANRALDDAVRERLQLEQDITAAEDRVSILQVKLGRARRTESALRAVRDEVALTQVTQNAPPMTDVEKKLLIIGSAPQHSQHARWQSALGMSP
jgi:hypothetical protein